MRCWGSTPTGRGVGLGARVGLGVGVSVRTRVGAAAGVSVGSGSRAAAAGGAGVSNRAEPAMARIASTAGTASAASKTRGCRRLTRMAPRCRRRREWEYDQPRAVNIAVVRRPRSYPLLHFIANALACLMYNTSYADHPESHHRAVA